MFNFFSVVRRTKCSNCHSFKAVTCLKNRHPEISPNWHVLEFSWGLLPITLHAFFFLILCELSSSGPVGMMSLM